MIYCKSVSSLKLVEGIFLLTARFGLIFRGASWILAFSGPGESGMIISDGAGIGDVMKSSGVKSDSLQIFVIFSLARPR